MKYITIISISFFIGLVFQYIISYLISKRLPAFSGTMRNYSLLIFILIGLLLAHPYLLIEEKIKSIIKNILEFLIIIAFAFATSNFLNHLIDNYFKKFENIPPTTLFKNSNTIFILITAILFALHNVGIKVTPLLTGLGIGGLAIALALQPTLTNIFSGLQIILSRKIRIGDYIKTESGDEGYVFDISWRDTILYQSNNNFTIIPNSKLANSIFTNFYLPQRETLISITIPVNYENDIDKVEKLINQVIDEILKTSDEVIHDFKPIVRIQHLS
jgi:small-conductance mechanosensitive channel